MPETYIPILRNDGNEKKVIKRFNRSSLSGETERKLSMAPLLEIKAGDDIDEIGPYEDAGDYLMIELPRYLREKENKYQEDVAKMIDDYGGVNKYYRAHSEEIDIPVISGSFQSVDYSEYPPAYDSLADDFDRLAIRLFIRGFIDPFTEDQRQSLEELADLVSHRDILLYDLVEHGSSEVLEDNLEHLSGLFGDSAQAVLNAFNAYEGDGKNRSPSLADSIGAEAFGDFGINKRFRGGGGPPARVYQRHYLPGQSTVEFFPGEDYQEAAEKLRNWEKWNRSHCDGCRRADRTSNYDPNTWSQIKTEHYISTILAGDI